MNKIIIGCANFGMQYGISKKNKITHEDIQDIANEAILNNIRTLDTAVDYHGSHTAIELNSTFNNFNIITKVRSLNVANLCEKNLLVKINSGFSVERVRTVLLHDEDFYKSKEGQSVYKKLQVLKKNGNIDKIGVSVYDFKNAKRICDNFEIDIVQIPFNPFNQQFTYSNINELRNNNSHLFLHARSILLQGVLATNSQNIIRYKYENIFKKWDQFLNSQGKTGLQYCVEYTKNNFIDNKIFGIRSKAQLKMLIEEEKAEKNNFEIFECSVPKKLYDPRFWPK